MRDVNRKYNVSMELVSQYLFTFWQELELEVPVCNVPMDMKKLLMDCFDTEENKSVMIFRKVLEL